MSKETWKEGLIAPPFVRLRSPELDPKDPNSWDAWVVEPTGDKKADYLKGAEYCDMALRKVNATQNPGAMTFPLTAMIGKLLAGQIEKGEIEKGFMDRFVHLASERVHQLDQN